MDELTYIDLATQYIAVEKKVRLDDTAHAIFKWFHEGPQSVHSIHQRLLKEKKIVVDYKNVHERMTKTYEMNGLIGKSAIGQFSSPNEKFYQLTELGWFFAIDKGMFDLALALSNKDLDGGDAHFPFYLKELLSMFEKKTIQHLRSSAILTMTLQEHTADLCSLAVDAKRNADSIFERFQKMDIEAMKAENQKMSTIDGIRGARYDLFVALVQAMAVEKLRNDDPMTAKESPSIYHKISDIPLGVILMSDKKFLERANPLKPLFKTCYEILDVPKTV